MLPSIPRQFSRGGLIGPDTGDIRASSWSRAGAHLFDRLEGVEGRANDTGRDRVACSPRRAKVSMSPGMIEDPAQIRGRHEEKSSKNVHYGKPDSAYALAWLPRAALVHRIDADGLGRLPFL